MKKILLVCFLFVSALTVLAQEKVFTGKVISATDGSPLPGVNVILKGTGIGSVTNADGSFSISVPQSGAVLMFSFIGLKAQEVDVTGKASMDVRMEDDATQLSEVVVTGLGWQQESRTLGYAVAKVEKELINQANAMNVFTGLSGKVAGLQIRTTNNGINPATRVTLRGNRSLTGNNQALVVLDGIVVPNNTLNSINNNDIENVTILKGASAAAIYGSDATNGVLLITLKKGTQKTPEISFSHTTQFEKLAYMPKFQSGWGPGTNPYSRGYISFENQSYGPKFDGSQVTLGKPLEDGSIQTDTYSARPDSKSDVWNTGVLNQNWLGFSAGDDDSRFDMSLQDVQQTGIVPRDEYRRTGGRLSASQKVGKFQGSFNMIYTNITTSQNASPISFYWDVVNHGVNTDFKKYRNWRNFQNADGSLNFGNPNNYFNDYYENPYVGIDMYRINNKASELTGNVQVDYKPTDWLNVTYRAGLTNNLAYGKTTTEKFDFRDYAAATRYFARADIPGAVADFSTNFRRVQSDIIATIAKSFGKFDLQFITGTQVIDEAGKFINVATTNLVVPEVYNIANRTGEVQAFEGINNVRKVGMFGDLTMTYNDIITLHFAGRRDQTSLLAKGNNVYFYPAVDMAFIASDAIPALKDNNVLDFLKLSAGYAKVGQVNVGAYALDPVFNAGPGFPYGSVPGFVMGNVTPDPNLQPEFLKNLEFSTEMRFFGERLGMTFTYYKQNASNQTVQIATSSATGYTNALINAGEMQNSGFEIELGAKVIDREGLQVGADLNYANRNTKVVSLYQGLDEVALGNNIFAIKGQQYPALKVDRYKRNPDGKVIVDPETGYPLDDQAGLTYAGQTEPKHVFGITPYVKYKRFALSVTAEYRAGAVVWHGAGENMTFTGVAKITGTYDRERFIFPNSVLEVTGNDGAVSYADNTSVAVEDGGVGFWDNHFDTVSENFVTSASFWKIREVSLSYKFPQELLGSTKFIKKASIALVGRNLVTLLPKSNLYTDPEFNVGNGNAIGFNNIGINPPTRFYGATLDLTF